MTFGRTTGLRVSELALGTVNFGASPGQEARDEATQVLRQYVEAGGCFIDTSSNYQDGAAEELLADLVGTDRDQYVLGTKFGRGASDATHLSLAGNSRRAMVHSVEQSLRRLRTDRLDMLWAHFEDGVTPIEEILRAFDDLVRAGKILHAGLSNFPAWRVARGQTIAELRGQTPITAIQIEHSLVERSAERELLPMAEALGLGVGTYSVLGGGLLTGKYRGDTTLERTAAPGARYREDSPSRIAVVDAVIAVAAELGCTPAAVAVAWQRHVARRSTGSLVTIVGPRTPRQLDTYLAALDLALDEEHFRRLDTVSAIPRGAPYDSVAGPTDMGDRGRVARPVVPAI